MLKFSLAGGSGEEEGCCQHHGGSCRGQVDGDAAPYLALPHLWVTRSWSIETPRVPTAGSVLTHSLSVTPLHWMQPGPSGNGISPVSGTLSWKLLLAELQRKLGNVENP